MASRPALTIIRCIVATTLALGLAPTVRAEEEGIRIGRTERIQSKVLGEQRTLLVALPDRYALFDERLPVLYLLDGQENFEHVAGLVRFMGRVGQMPRMIVVGIVNTDRVRDFTPTAVPEAFNGRAKTSGGAGKFLQFMERELFPFIQSKYRTAPYRILVGHSLTAMFATHVLLTRPTLFNAIIAAGPYLAWDDRVVMADLAKKLAALPDEELRFHVSHGGQGEAENGVDRDVKALCDALGRHAPKNLKWAFSLYPKDHHDSAIHPAVLDGLRHIFPDWRPDAGASLDELTAHYAKLSQRYGYPVPVPEGMLNLRGYRALMAERTDEAIRIFAKNVELHPASANVYDSLGEAYEAAGELDQALANYEKAVELYSKQAAPDARILGIYRQHAAHAAESIEAHR